MAMKMNGNLQLAGVRGWGRTSQDEAETWDRGGTQESVEVTLAVIHTSGTWNLKNPPPVVRQDLSGSRHTNPPTKL